MGRPALDAFYLDRLPVTNAQFNAFVTVTGYRPTGSQASRFLSHWPAGHMPKAIAKHPVTNVSWHDAQTYASWTGKRLPTEAEWEKAARGTDGRNYPWGRESPIQTGPGAHANFGNKGVRGVGTTPVGQYPAGASPYGVLDMAGNVWEWCEDADDEAFYDDGPTHNPRNAPAPSSKIAHARVMRGGAWMYGPRSLRTFARVAYEEHARFSASGFRCARTA